MVVFVIIIETSSTTY